MLVFLYTALGSNLSLNGEGILSRTKSRLTFRQIHKLFIETMAGPDGVIGSALVRFLHTYVSINRSKRLASSYGALGLNPTLSGGDTQSQTKSPLAFRLNRRLFMCTMAGPDLATGSGLARLDRWTIGFDHSRKPALLRAASA